MVIIVLPSKIASPSSCGLSANACLCFLLCSKPPVRSSEPVWQTHRWTKQIWLVATPCPARPTRDCGTTGPSGSLPPSVEYLGEQLAAMAFVVRPTLGDGTKGGQGEESGHATRKRAAPVLGTNASTGMMPYRRPEGTLRRLSSSPPSEQADGSDGEENKGGRARWNSNRSTIPK